jgi:replicative DNA helicase
MPLDVRVPRATIDSPIEAGGFVLYPHILYLASTVEYTESHEHLPILNGKCFAPGTKVWMADATRKNIEDIKPGHYVLGVNDDIHRVREVHSGTAEMFRVDQSRGMSYVVNGEHELVLRCGRGTDNKRFQDGDVVTVSVREFAELTENVKKHVYGFRSSVTSFMCDEPLVVDPYLLGVWLGDGTSDSAQLTINNDDEELLAYLRVSFPLAKFHQYKPGALTVVLTTHEKTNFVRPNSFLQGLRSLGVVSNKHIPKVYLLAALRDRLALLAGLLDTDGSPNGCGWEITTKFPALRDGIIHLATSVGLTASVASKVVEGNEYQRINISGDVSCIPVKLSRKRDKIRESKIVGRTDSQLTVTPVGVGEFYGFSLEGEHPEDALFFLEDFTVVHNSSLGRLGLSIHVTAGTGDVGFRGHWTMELFVIQPLRIYAGMAIGQLLWFTANSEPDVSYDRKPSAKYGGAGPLPQASLMHQEK